jgi:hypothetical protein
MQKETDTSLIRLYLYSGLGFILLNSLGEYFAYRETFIQRSINSVFLVSYLSCLH